MHDERNNDFKADKGKILNILVTLITQGNYIEQPDFLCLFKRWDFNGILSEIHEPIFHT